MAKLVRARRNPFASEAFAHDFDQVIAGLRAKGVKCIVSAPSGDSGSSDSQDVAADFILHGSVLQVVVIWLDLLNTQRSPSSNREAMVSQETRAVLEDKISKIQDSRVVVMVRAASMSVFEECQLRLLGYDAHVVPILNVDNACQIMVNLLLLTQADRLPIDETKISKAAALKTLCVVPGVGKKAAAQLVDGLQTLNCIFGASNEQLKLEVGTRTAASLGALLDYDHTNSVVRTRTKDNSNTKER
eukprot:INCI1043.1.p1 GENE.INCI1043.1~~INCI1043.1.p1  ORF type:complete len:245 (+),score=45.94 INCI1043.1:101-835(+)